MNLGPAVISSYSDLSKLSQKVKSVHFRKFVSRKLLEIILEKCPRLESISLSKYAHGRLHFDFLKYKRVKIIISGKSSGRPNLVENIW